MCTTVVASSQKLKNERINQKPEFWSDNQVLQNRPNGVNGHLIGAHVHFQLHRINNSTTASRSSSSDNLSRNNLLFENSQMQTVIMLIKHQMEKHLHSVRFDLEKSSNTSKTTIN